MLLRIHNTSTAASAEVASSGRQPKVGTRSQASPAAMIVPRAQKLSSMTRLRPRFLVGRNSA